VGDQRSHALLTDVEPSPRHGIRPKTLLLAAISLAAVSGAAYLLTQHPAHSLPYLPYLLLAACPLLHFFHHRSHR
jgi:hypothetical protein